MGKGLAGSLERAEETMDKSQGAPLTIREVLFSSGQPDASTAIIGVDGTGFTYGQLRGLVAGAVGSLGRMGFRNSDRIALALPNGPLLAYALVAVSAGFGCAPLNPNYRPREFEGLLARLRVKAILVERGADSPARGVAKGMGIDVIDVDEPVSGGRFLVAGSEGMISDPKFSEPVEDAFLLHTSGTTGAPKLVPLTHSNICHSVHYIRNAMALGPTDRCLNVMPLFHGLGLVSLLSTLLSGGSIACAAGFHEDDFFLWLDRLKPTWYTAVPPVHQSILAKAGEHGDMVARSRLRFIRSAAAPLPPKLMLDLEACFRAPVVEAYGMTEAFLIGSTPLPPKKRKPGSVGVAMGPDMGVIDNVGRFLGRGEVGEIVVKGPNVMRGYEGEDGEKAGTFIDGWMRTGDLGHIDGEGYIFIDGRVKEVINRGGEKVTPNEVDNALKEHPAVSEAAAFGVPHGVLGEDVAAAVTLKAGSEASEGDLRLFASERLAPHKVPSRIFFVDALPKGPSGKILRRRLPDILGLREAAVPKKGGAEEVRGGRAGGDIVGELIGIWESEMGLRGIGPGDNFFHLGGYSLMAARIFRRIEERFGIRLPLAVIYRKPTVADLAAELEGSDARTFESLVPLRKGGGRPRLFIVHPVGGEVVNYGELVEALGEDQPVYAFRAAGLYDRAPLPKTVEAMAKGYVDEMKAFQPKGPYHLAGWCAGGAIAFEIAQQLRRAGDDVGLLAVLDFEAPEESYWGSRRAARGTLFRETLYLGADLLKYAKRRKLGRSLDMVPRAVRLGKVGMRAAGIISADEVMLHGEFAPLPDDWKAAILNTQRILRSYRPSTYDGVVTVFKRSALPLVTSQDPADGWGKYAGGGVVVVHVSGRMHYAVVRKPWVRATAKGILERMDWHERRLRTKKA